MRIGSGSPFDSFRNDFVDELTASVSGTIPEDTDEDGDGAVSYTHLTLPTIYSV